MGTEDPLRIGTFPAPRALALAAFGGAGAALLAALAFQYLGGLAPCPLCIEQRYPHGVGGALALSAAFAAPPVHCVVKRRSGLMFTLFALLLAGGFPAVEWVE